MPSSALYQHHDDVGAVDTTFFCRRQGVSGGGSSSLEQFATSDKNRQLTAAVSGRDKSTSEYLRARVGYVEFLAKMTFLHHLIAFKELYPTVKLDFLKYELN